MAVDPTIEDFAFSLFRKLWIKNGFPDIRERVSDYPDVPDACSDDFCDTVYAFQCISSSFYEALCDADYYAFAQSRSDFFYYLASRVNMLDQFQVEFDHAIISLAALAAEMGYTCARRDNSIFVYSCPLAFAMVLEEKFGHYFEVVGVETAWNELAVCGRRFVNTRIHSDFIGRSASARRGLVYFLLVLSHKMREKCFEFSEHLRAVVKLGGTFDHPGSFAQLYAPKFLSAVFFPFYLETVYGERFQKYLIPLIANIPLRNEDRRAILFREIASLVDNMNEEEENTFVTIYEETIGKYSVEPPPYPEITKLYHLDPDCTVPRKMQEDDRCPNKREAVHKHEDRSKMISDPPTLYELYGLKPKDVESQVAQNDCNLDASSKRPEEPSKTISDASSVREELVSNDTSHRDTRPSVVQTFPRNASVTTSELADEVWDAPPPNVDLEDALPPYKSLETYELDFELKCVEKCTIVQRIQETPSFYVNPPPCELAVLNQPVCSSGPKKFGECTNLCEVNNIENQAEDLQLPKPPKDDGCTELCEGSPRELVEIIRRDVDSGHQIDKLGPCQELTLSMDKKAPLTTLESSPSTKYFHPKHVSELLTDKHTTPSQPSNIIEACDSNSLETAFKTFETTYQDHVIFSEERRSFVTPRSFSNTSEVSPKAGHLITTRGSEIAVFKGIPLMRSQFKEEDKMKDDSLPYDGSTSSLDIFFELYFICYYVYCLLLRWISGSPGFVNTPENSMFHRNSCALEVKDQKVATDTSAPEIGNQDIYFYIGTIASELEVLEISEDISTSQVKDPGISAGNNTSNFKKKERYLDTSDFELINLGMLTGTDAPIIVNQEITSDTNGYLTKNILEHTDASMLDDMVVFPDSPVSQNDAEGTKFGFEEPSKNITSSPEVCLKSKRVVETDHFEDLKITVYFSPKIRDQEIFASAKVSESKNLSMFSPIDNPVRHNNSKEEHADFEAFNDDSLESTSMDVKENKKSLLDDCQSSVFLKQLNTENNEDENDDFKQQIVQMPLSPKQYRKEAISVSTEKMDSGTSQKTDNNLQSLEQQKSATKDKQPKSAVPGDDCSKLTESIEDENKTEKGRKKRKHRMKQKNEQDSGKETEGLTIKENEPEKSQVTELDVHQMVLIVGVPFDEPIEQDTGFMDRITIKRF